MASLKDFTRVLRDCNSLVLGNWGRMYWPEYKSHRDGVVLDWLVCLIKVLSKTNPYLPSTRRVCFLQEPQKGTISESLVQRLDTAVRLLALDAANLGLISSTL